MKFYCEKKKKKNYFSVFKWIQSSRDAEMFKGLASIDDGKFFPKSNGESDKAVARIPPIERSKKQRIYCTKVIRKFKAFHVNQTSTFELQFSFKLF